MKLHEIAFQGYKAYAGAPAPTQRLIVAPLTLVFGKNNSGKSAVVRLPKLVLGGIECTDGRVLPIEVRGLRYGHTFLDLVHGGAFFSRPVFAVHAEHQGEELDFTATLFSRGALAADEPPHIWSYVMRMPAQISLPGPPEPGCDASKFAGLLPPDTRWDAWRKAAGTMLNGMIHMGPTREPVFSSYANEQVSRLGFRGAEAPHLLRADGALADAVGDWYAKHMEGWRLSLKKDSDSFSLRVGRNSTLATNLAQGGEGLQQVLPVVVHQLWRQRNDAGAFLDVIEQPELHLHAAAQAPLADLFIDTARQGRGQLLVETNSEPILLRVQRRVAEGVLPRDLVALYYVELTEHGSQLKPVPINDDGEVDWWPEGVFEEDFHEVAAIRRAQRGRARGGQP